jgi:hypothetical protein
MKASYITNRRNAFRQLVDECKWGSSDMEYYRDRFEQIVWKCCGGSQKTLVNCLFLNIHTLVKVDLEERWWKIKVSIPHWGVLLWVPGLTFGKVYGREWMNVIDNSK